MAINTTTPDLSVFMVQYQSETPAKDGSLSADKKLLTKQAPRERIASLEKMLAATEAQKACLIAENALLKQLYEDAPFAYQTLDSSGCFLDVNQAWLETLGYTRKEVIGRNFGAFLNPEWQKHFKENFPKFKAIGEIFVVEFEMARKDGSAILVSFQGKIGKDSDGNFQQTHCIFQNISQRTKTDKVLCESEARLRLAQESTNVGIWDWKVEEGKLEFTPELNKLYGLPAGAIKSYQDWRDRVHPDDIDKLEVKRDAAIANHQPFDLEFRGRRASGEYCWISTKGGAIYSEEGTIVRVLGVNIDISERKQAERDLQDSETRFRTMANAMPLLAWIARPDGYVIWYNQRWYEYTDTVFEQMEGWGWQCVQDPKELSNVLERWKASLATGEPFEMIISLRGGDGVFRPFLTRGFPLKDNDGCVQQWFGTNTDISELKRFEQELRASEALYRSIAESIDYGVWVCTPDGRNTYASESFLKMVGITQEQCSNFGWGSVLHPDDAEGTISAWRECARTGGNWDIEHRFLGADGQWHPVLARGVPVRDEHGEITCWAGINLDISRLKQAEEQIKASLAEKEVMLREIHHRVKNNLQIISSLVSLQANNLTDQRIREEFSDVNNHIYSIALVHEKIYLTNNLARLDFAEYAADLLHFLWSYHGALAEKIQLNIVAEPIELTVEMAVPCGLILNELVSNALKHAFHDGSSGEVVVGIEHNSDTYAVCLRVSDNGIGFPPGLDWRRSDSLGLRLVQILAGQLRGTVEAESGPGTEFRVTFPLDKLQS